MRQLRAIFQTVIIVDSLSILVVVVSVLTLPQLQGLLPVAGGLAGLSTALHAWTLDGITTRLRALLLAAGLVTILTMALVGVLAGTH